MSGRNERLAKFSNIPQIAQMDFRNFLDEDGKHRLLSKLSRSKRRLLKKEGEKISRIYQSIMNDLIASGSAFPVSELLRAMTLEYINRFASSGTGNQPISFNYFEPFCWPKLIPGSVAPYFKLKNETDHLFDLTDLIDFLTSDEIDINDVSSLGDMPDSEIYHFSTGGDLFGTTVFDANRREFVISGFSMVKIGEIVHWFLLAGEVFSEREWGEMKSYDISGDITKAPAWKRKFLEEVIEREGGNSGPPLPLEGTETAWRTIVAGEFDFVKRKHISRAYFAETEKSFLVFCDDPEVIASIPENDRARVAQATLDKMAQASSLWNLAEGLLHLPSYFSARVAVSKKVLDRKGLSIDGRQKRGGKGLSQDFCYVTSTEIVDGDVVDPIVKVTLPHFETETHGHWRRLDYNSFGKDENGNSVQGKTWVRKSSPWKARQEFSTVVYVKDTLSSARTNIEQLEHAIKRAKPMNAETFDPSVDDQELYIMRCATMAEKVFKVGWTRGSSYDRAKNLSAATGVPEAFIVVHHWKHHNAEGLETEVHAILAPYRVSNRREFFNIGSDVIVRVIEQVLKKRSAKSVRV